MNNKTFFQILGYLSNPKRKCKLDAEVPPKRKESFEGKYKNLTNNEIEPDSHNYYLLREGTDKWGLELRIYFVKLGKIPGELEDITVDAIPETNYNARVNNNQFIWRLIKYGFRLGNEQNEKLVKNKVPNKYTKTFMNGYKMR